MHRSTPPCRFLFRLAKHRSNSCWSVPPPQLPATRGAPASAPPPPEHLEFYFGIEMPESAGENAILADGFGFSHHDESGLDYGWDCDGDVNVNYEGGRRHTTRDHGLGINHL